METGKKVNCVYDFDLYCDIWLRWEKLYNPACAASRSDAHGIGLNLAGASIRRMKHECNGCWNIKLHAAEGVILLLYRLGCLHA